MTDEIKNEWAEMFNAIPHALKTLHNEAHEVGKTLVGAQLKAQDIVTRSEFEEQKDLLMALMEKLTQIEQILIEKPTEK